MNQRSLNTCHYFSLIHEHSGLSCCTSFKKKSNLTRWVELVYESIVNLPHSRERAAQRLSPSLKVFSIQAVLVISASLGLVSINKGVVFRNLEQWDASRIKTEELSCWLKGSRYTELKKDTNHQKNTPSLFFPCQLASPSSPCPVEGRGAQPQLADKRTNQPDCERPGSNCITWHKLLLDDSKEDKGCRTSKAFTLLAVTLWA